MICDIQRSAVRTPEKPHCERLFSDQGSFIQAFQVLTMTAVPSFSGVTCRSICHLLSSHYYLSSSQWLSWKTIQFMKSLTSSKPPSHDDKQRSCNRAVRLLYSSSAISQIQEHHGLPEFLTTCVNISKQMSYFHYPLFWNPRAEDLHWFQL